MVNERNKNYNTRNFESACTRKFIKLLDSLYYFFGIHLFHHRAIIRNHVVIFLLILNFVVSFVEIHFYISMFLPEPLCYTTYFRCRSINYTYINIKITLTFLKLL